MHNRIPSILFFLLVIGFLTNEPFLITLAISILIIIGIAWWWQNRSLRGVRYQRRFQYTRGFPGELINLRTEVENYKFLPISWLRIQDNWENAVGPEDENILAPSHIKDHGYLTNIYSLRWYEKIRRSYTLLLRRRGIYAIGPAKVDSGDLLGIFEKVTTLETHQYLTVFPSLFPFERLNFPTEDPFGDKRSIRPLYEDPNCSMGIREYRPEDSFRRIHWPATAQTGKLQVKVFQPITGKIIVICLNVTTFEHHWQGVKSELLEHLVKIAASIADEGIRRGYKVGLISNGCLAHADQPFRIPPGRSPQQLAILLEALAGVTFVVTSNFERFLIREVPRIQYGATLVVLTSIITGELAPTLIQLKRHERRITLYSIADDEPPIMPGIQIVHQPFKTPENL